MLNRGCLCRQIAHRFSNLAAWRADGTISSDDELKSDWLRLANSQ